MTKVPVLQIALTQAQYCTPPLLEAADRCGERLWRHELAAGHRAIRSHPLAVTRFVTGFVDHVSGMVGMW